MSYAENLWLFLLLVGGIIIVPGMDMLYVLTSGLSGGRRAGLSATAGTMAGGAIHTLYGTLGTAILVALAPAFYVPLLVAGALYMIWIGFSLVRSTVVVESVEAGAARSLAVTFRRAFLTCLMNPKAYLFVIAVYPQFLRPEYGPFWLQGLAMGAITALVQAVVYGAIALAAARAGGLLTGHPGATIWFSRGAGILLIVAACLTLWQGMAG